jgi:hypothetical protein
MKPFPANRPRRHHALETAADELREARGTDRDEILAARRALWKAEKAHDRAVTQAQRDIVKARAPSPIDAYGHELILYDDRLSTPTRTHQLGSSVRAEVIDAPTGDAPVQLVAHGPDWEERITAPHRDKESLERLASAIAHAAANTEAVEAARRAKKRPAEERLVEARTDLLAVEQAKPLIDRVAELAEPGERVLDLAPGISTGHDGVLIVTDRRLLFVGLRHTLPLPYGQITSVSAGGRWFGARLTVSTDDGRKSVVSGLPARHAAEIADFARGQLVPLEPRTPSVRDA